MVPGILLFIVVVLSLTLCIEDEAAITIFLHQIIQRSKHSRGSSMNEVLEIFGVLTEILSESNLPTYY